MIKSPLDYLNILRTFSKLEKFCIVNKKNFERFAWFWEYMDQIKMVFLLKKKLWLGGLTPKI